MAMLVDPENCVWLSTRRKPYAKPPAQFDQEGATMRMNYMASRLRAALYFWSHKSHGTPDFQWWWDGLNYELASVSLDWDLFNLTNSQNASMSIVGHAASHGIYVEIPPFLRGLSASMIGGHPGPSFLFDEAMWQDIERPLDEQDPTERVEEYHQSWWLLEKTTPPHQFLDVEAAYEWHCDKVF
jgi:hypothetical protein